MNYNTPIIDQIWKKKISKFVWRKLQGENHFYERQIQKWIPCEKEQKSSNFILKIFWWTQSKLDY